MQIHKIYNPKEVEGKWYKFWLDNGYFNASPNPELKPFSIVIPPPNVTDVLHLGQALNNTIQDIFIRWKRMQGFEAEWLPGVDHAGIATEVIVEKEILKGESKEKIGKEKFIELVWKWVHEKKDTIIAQLKDIGCSCDWTRTRFTLDEGLSNAVYEAFVRLYKKRMIYKGDYIVNWCPRCETALADEEVEHKEINGKLYYINYPILPVDGQVKGKNKFIQVATTRPETMLGDTACAVNPKDKKNAKFIKCTAILPLMNREIPVISDDVVDPKFGTGVVKVTPAHDPIDFELSIRHNLPKILIMDKRGVINENGGKYNGLDRFDARKKILSELKTIGLLAKTTPYRYSLGHCYRCNTVVEPILSEQWFVKMKEMAKPAIEAVENGIIKFYPDRWKGVYLNWMYNIKDWCISRQIWWGHRIPVWYCKEMLNEKCKMQNGVIVSTKRPENCPYCESKTLVQDTNVLDTWFSSWLWPFSTFGWPEETDELNYFYPTSMLSTASEIIFFWVARMIMAGYEFTGKPPFKDVYIHGTVRDAQGRKMSKSLGNGIDPRDIIKDYGTDAMRFSLITAAGEGQDPHIATNTFESGRNFTNKIWNAYRLIASLPDAEEKPGRGRSPDLPLSLADRWILSRIHKLTKDVTELLSRYKLQEPLMRIYDFLWHDFCDWYLEIIKIKKCKGIALEILDRSLKLLHPFMPFVTEEVWQMITHKEPSIMVSKWPEAETGYFDSDAEKGFEIIKNIIITCRNTRATMNIPKTKLIRLLVKCGTRERSIIDENKLYIEKLGKVKAIEFTESVPKGCTIKLTKGVEIFIPLSGLIDLKAELKKLETEQLEVSSLLKSIQARLSSPDFLSKAPREIVKKTREKVKEYEQKLLKLQEHINLIKL
ncbi:MAG: valine--tRNA ligase [bacterium]|nr:valine--tRNA ligase [bacterium]